jgi:hypothetical protein
MAINYTIQAQVVDATVDSPNSEDVFLVHTNDLFILKHIKKHGVVQVIMDDGDFATVAGIQVFTANRNVISAARSQGKLLTR